MCSHVEFKKVYQAVIQCLLDIQNSILSSTGYIDRILRDIQIKKMESVLWISQRQFLREYV